MFAGACDDVYTDRGILNSSPCTSNNVPINKLLVSLVEI